MTEVNSKKTVVNSWNEWDPLKHVIVGRADGTMVQAPEPAHVPYLQFEPGTVQDRKAPTSWSRVRRERAVMISRATGANTMQADALAKAAIRMDVDPDTFDWDQLQGDDLSHEDRITKMEDMAGSTTMTEREQLAEAKARHKEDREKEAYRKEAMDDGNDN